jgi:hypothetical protein
MRSVPSTTPVAGDPASLESGPAQPSDAPAPAAAEAPEVQQRPRLDLDARALQTYLRWVDKNVAEARVRLVLESGRDGKIDPERTRLLRELARAPGVLRASADGSPLDAAVATRGTNLFVDGRELRVPAGLPESLFAPPPQVIERPPAPPYLSPVSRGQAARTVAEPNRPSARPNRADHLAVASVGSALQPPRPTSPTDAAAESGARPPTPPDDPSAVPCPSCRLADRVQTIEAARSAAKVRAGEASHAGAGPGAGRAELAGRLAPPPPPPAYQSPWGRWSLALVSVAVGFGAALLDRAATGASVRWNAMVPDDDGARAIVLVASLVLLAAIAVVLNRSSEARSRRASVERQLAWHRKLLSVWEQTLYCCRCDVVFRPGQPRFARPDALHAMLELT